MKIALDFENVLTKNKGFDFANDLLNEGVEVHIITSRIGHIKSEQNRDLLKVVRDLNLPYSNVIFTLNKQGYFANHSGFKFYASDNMIDLQLVDKDVNCIPVFGNNNWISDCLDLVADR